MYADSIPGANPMMNQKDVKRGRLRRVTIKHMYNEDGNLAGHTVTAEHGPDMEGMKGKSDGPSYMPSPPDIETPHETYDSAEAKAKEHHMDNMKRFGKGGAKKAAAPAMDEAPMRMALGRKR
jgi:hypothetical protein